MSSIGKAELGMITFFASSHPTDKCGANGLPLTPNSIKVMGNFQQLTVIDHPHLCKYLHIVRGKHERLIIVAEHYKDSLSLSLPSGKHSSEDNLKELAFEVLIGLEYMNTKGLTHRNLSPSNILFDTKGKVKLAKYGMYHMTDQGADVSFPIGLPKYMPPEVVCAGPVQVDEHNCTSVQAPSGPKVDAWSLAIILLEALLGQRLWSSLSIQQTLQKILDFTMIDDHPLDAIARDLTSESLAKLQLLSEEMRDFFRQCLTVSPNNRPCPADLLQHPAFRNQRLNQVPYKNGVQLFSIDLRCRDLELPKYDKDGRVIDTDEEHIEQRSFEEVFYLWLLAGGDLETTLKKSDLVKARPPINLLPNFGGNEGEVFGQERDGCELLDDKVILLSQDQLRQRLENIDEAAYYPLLEDETVTSTGLPSSPSTVDLSDTATLPLVIREKDIEYQFHRIILYERLLKAYPYKRAHIWKEARVDVPPLVRAHVWATLLEVEGDVQGKYDAIDKETPTPTDRQIEVDIPRCHQYDELLSSPVAHLKFKRILKAWVVSHPQYVYWQGLDSLCAPFLSLNFNNEALAFACLQAFIPKYLHKFFMKDNSAVIQEYLAVFSHLIAFHDPELSNHLDGIGFIPDLYAIPWFLTMYAHVFPLRKIKHLWDTLLLGNSSLPLCIGVAILQQLRDRLLSYGFNECILLFSDMPEIDIEKVVQESIKVFCSTPKSSTYRQHARPARKVQEKKDGRPNVSYYSRDYHELPANELSMEPMTIEELKSEKFPRISAEDLIELSELSGSANTRSPTKKSLNSKPKLLIIDVRSPDEYKRGTVPNSISIPFQTAFNPEGDLVQSAAVQVLNSHRPQVKVVVGSRGKVASNFANELVRLSYTKTCVLHKGIDVLRPTGLLTVPPADI